MNFYLQLYCLTIFLRYGFVDGADAVQYVDLPSFNVVTVILRKCLCEIILKGMADEDNGIIMWTKRPAQSSKLNHAKAAR